MDGNIKDTPPIVIVPLDEDRPRWDESAEQIPERQEAARRASRKPRGRSSTPGSPPRSRRTWSTEIPTSDLELLRAAR